MLILLWSNMIIIRTCTEDIICIVVNQWMNLARWWDNLQ